MAEHSGPAASRAPAEGVFDAESLRLQHHALRQPLNALGLFCAALKMQPLTPAQQPLVAGIADAAQAIESLVDQHFSALRGQGAPAEHASALPTTPGLPAGPMSAAGLPEQPQPQPYPQASNPPASAAHGPAEASADHGVAPVDPVTRPRPAWRVTVVDDDYAARNGMLILLEAWGAEVQGFASIQALRAWTSQPTSDAPDLLVLDYHLPRPGDGLEALRLVRQAWPGRCLPALLITGDERAAVANALSDGSLECLVKPVTAGPLLAALRRYLGPQFGV